MDDPIRCLYIDVAPFAGGAQQSLRELAVSVPGELPGIAAGCGAELLFRDAGIPLWKISAKHWSAGIWGGCNLLLDAVRNREIFNRALSEHRPDVVHCNTVRSALLLLAARVNPGCPVVIYDRDLRMPRCLIPLISRKLKPWIIAVSSRVAEKWRGYVPESRIYTVPNGFNLEAIRGTEAWKPPFAKDCFIAVQVADFESWKRHFLFIDAVGAAYSKDERVRGVIKGRVRGSAGKKYYSSVVEYIRKSGLEKVVIIDTGECSGLSCIAGSDAVVVCSLDEPFGRTTVEGLILGKRVIATEKACAQEIINCSGGGVICAESSAESIAAGILGVMRDGGGILPGIAEDFDIRRIAAKIAEIHNKTNRTNRTYKTNRTNR